MSAGISINVTRQTINLSGGQAAVVTKTETRSMVIDRGVTIINNYGGTAQITNETPTGLVNGVNKIFVSESDISGNSLAVYLDGYRLTPGKDYGITSSDTFVLVIPPTTGSVLLVDYKQPLTAPSENISFSFTDGNLFKFTDGNLFTLIS